MRGKESIEENCARIPLEMGFWVRDSSSGTIIFTRIASSSALTTL